MHLHQTDHGWEIVTANGRRLASFKGVGSKRRALLYVTDRGMSPVIR